MSTQGPFETEIKLRMEDPEAARALLEGVGFRIHRQRVFETNTVFDTAGSELQQSGRLLRLRSSGEDAVLTYKGPADLGGRHKSRPELEISISDFETTQRIFEALGYRPTFRYDKFRAEFTRSGEPGTATVDETPIGCFVELEGTPSWIDRVVQELGKGDGDYITSSYGSLYLQHCKDQSISPGFMTFPQISTE